MNPTHQTVPPRQTWRAAQLRPQRTLAGSRSYYRCAVSPDGSLVAFGLQPTIYGAPGNARPSVLVLPTGAPRRLNGAEVYVAPVAPARASADAAHDPGAGRAGAARCLTPGWGTSWGPAWSPDGRRLAFCSDRNGTAQVWVWKRPEDDATADAGDHQDPAAGAARLACEQPVTMRWGYEGLRWLPDGRRLVAKLRPPGSDPYADAQRAKAARTGRLAGATGERDVWVSPPPPPEHGVGRGGASAPDLSRGDLASIDVDSGSAHRIGVGFVPRLVAVSPDGAAIAALCEREEDDASQDLNVSRFDLRLFPTAPITARAQDASRGTLLAERVRQAYGTDLSWSPRADALAFVTLADQPTAPGQLVVLGLDGTRRAFGGGTTGISVGHHQGFHPPLWAADGKTVYCDGTVSEGGYAAAGDSGPGGAGRATGRGTVLAVDLEADTVRDVGAPPGAAVTELVARDGCGVAPDFGRAGSLAVLALDDATRRIGLYRIGGGEPTRLIPDSFQGLRGISHGGDCAGRWIVGPGSTGDHPPIELYAYDTDTGQGRRITALHDHLVRLPRLESFLIPMEGLEGEERRAAVWLPSGYEKGRRSPTVVQLYLGSGTGPSRFDPERLPLAGAGYLTVRPDMPHVPGLDPADAATRYALAALDAAVAAGLGDRDRTAVLGHSAGGYDVCCVVTRTGRFRAAVAAAPFTDLVSSAQTVRDNSVVAGEVEGGHARMGGTLWEQRERYLANSPVFGADRVTTPLLLLCGTEDSLLPQAEEMYAALLRLGKRATLVRYHGEGHVPSDWLDENFDDYWARIIGWLDRHLA